MTAEVPAPAGFTTSIASTLHLAGGDRIFVKAGHVDSAAGLAVSTGAELAPVIGDLGPELLGHRNADGWSIAVYAHIPGEPIGSWDAAAVSAMQELSYRLRERFDPSPVSQTVAYAGVFAELLGCWEALGEPDHPNRRSVEHVTNVPLPVDLDVALLAELERDWFAEIGEGTALQHGDLRADNIVREPRGRLWLVDWTHRWTGPGWVDLVRLGPDLRANGRQDPEAFLRGSAWSDAPQHGVNVLLAGLAGRSWRDGHLPEEASVPHLRTMQRQQAHAALTWLESRLS